MSASDLCETCKEPGHGYRKCKGVCVWCSTTIHQGNRCHLNPPGAYNVNPQTRKAEQEEALKNFGRKEAELDEKIARIKLQLERVKPWARAVERGQIKGKPCANGEREPIGQPKQSAPKAREQKKVTPSLGKQVAGSALQLAKVEQWEQLVPGYQSSDLSASARTKIKHALNAQAESKVLAQDGYFKKFFEYRNETWPPQGCTLATDAKPDPKWKDLHGVEFGEVVDDDATTMDTDEV